MPKPPPFLPEETLARVLRVARFDGLGVLILGATFAVFAAAGREVPFAVVGLLAAGAGAVELHGVALLREGDARGMNWLVGSQPFLLLVIFSYCGLRLVHFEMPVLPEGLADLAGISAAQWNLTVEEYFRRLNFLTMAILACLATAYQGGLAFYYFRRRQAVAAALVAAPDV